MKRRLSMSYGLRWSPILPHHDVHRPVPYVMTFDVERYRQGIRSSVFVNAPRGISFPGDPGLTGAISTDLSSAQFGVIRNALDTRILQFALKYLF